MTSADRRTVVAALRRVLDGCGVDEALDIADDLLNGRLIDVHTTQEENEAAVRIRIRRPPPRQR